MKVEVLLLLGTAVALAQQTPPAFKAETNLVLVPVVVRDAKGEAVSNLTKADFRLFDNGKEQAITSFQLEETGGRVAQDRGLLDANASDANASSANGGAPAAQPNAAAKAIPEHFVALLFDDQHSKNCNPDPPPGYIGCVGDLWRGRDAARKMIKTLKPADRIGVFTSSGQVMLDFTADRAKIEEALMKLREGKAVLPTVANSMSVGLEIEDQTLDTVRWSSDIVHRMAHLPGTRTMVFVSPGLLLAPSALPPTMDLIDDAIRSRVVINSLDSRGLTAERAGKFWEFQMRVTDGTGGTFIRDTNDVNGGLERLAEAPKYLYVLGFSPQDIKQDGSFHHLTVKLKEGHNLDIQARAGYDAPDAKELARKASKPAATAAAEAPHLSEAETQQVAQALGIAANASAAVGSQPTFRAETNLVLVPAVVRDTNGNAVGGLGKDDFRLFRDGQSQTIASFSVEETSVRTVEDRSISGQPKAAPMVVPEHFAALMFDDAHFEFGRYEDIAYSRNAVLKYMDALPPGDRVALFTSSGLFNVDFTADRSKIRDALMKIAPGPALFYGMPGDEVARIVVGQCDKIVTRLALLPGTRTLIFVSAGLPIEAHTWSAVPDTMRLIDHAIRSHVVMSAMDVRGLSEMSPTSRAWGFQEDISDGTGGKFIRDTNDLDGAVRQLAATPKYIYVLGFSPDTAKAKKGFHKLGVKLRQGNKLEVQARNGYSDAGASELAEASKGTAPAAKTETPKLSEAETTEVAKALDIAPARPAGVTASAAAPKNDEITTIDQPTAFKVQTNLVEVPVVVRDRDGHAIGNLKQDDFRIMDKGKRQEITKFAIVKSSAPTAPAPGTKAQSTAPAPPAAPGTPAIPARFVAFVFDDVHLRFEDLPQARAAVVKYLNTSLGPQDRVALLTTSGKNSVDFTAKPEDVDAALLKVVPNPISPSALRTCLYISYFQAVQIAQQVSLHPFIDDLPRSLPLRVANFDANQCLKLPDKKSVFDTAVDEVRQAYNNGEQETRAALGGLKELVRRMAALPGQRSIVLVSPGFFVAPELQHENNDLESLAIRSKVLINTIDARGVWTDPGFDASRQGGPSAADISTFRRSDANAAADELIALAEDTGGAVNLNNDFFGGVQKAVATPEYMYVLGFVPQDLQPDGSFHTLKVTAGSGEKISLQARRGYWAPKHLEDEASASKQEIEDAVFSREEISGLPVDMHTRLTKVGEQAKLTVLANVDLKLIHLRKAEDRNRNDVTIIAALFDNNGNFLLGTEKILQLRLRDETVAGLQQKPPVVIGTDFNVKPGSYLVRLVARDSEGHQVTMENAAVQVQ